MPGITAALGPSIPVSQLLLHKSVIQAFIQVFIQKNCTIIKISKKIDSYETSILPFEDCCTVFLPDRPVTKPRLERIIESEKLLDVEELIKDAIDNMEVITVYPED